MTVYALIYYGTFFSVETQIYSKAEDALKRAKEIASSYDYNVVDKHTDGETCIFMLIVDMETILFVLMQKK